jgi:hypothetical protein
MQGPSLMDDEARQLRARVSLPLVCFASLAMTMGLLAFWLKLESKGNTLWLRKPWDH